MKEFIEKLIGRLEELYDRNDKMEKKAYEERDWENFELFMHGNEGVKELIEIVNELAEEYKDKYVMRETLNKYMWERDIAVSQLKDLGYGFGEKVGWIPCERELPEESGEYLTYVDYEDETFIAIDEIDCDGLIKEWNCTPNYHVIAWQPLPEPYKGE